MKDWCRQCGTDLGDVAVGEDDEARDEAGPEAQGGVRHGVDPRYLLWNTRQLTR